MQYILTQDELDALKARDKAAKNLPNVAELQKFCTFVADNMILKSGWMAGKAWGCVISAEEHKQEWYCDSCPALKVCPYEYKEFSK